MILLVFPSQKNRIRYVLTYYYRQGAVYVRIRLCGYNSELSFNIFLFL